MWPVLSVGRRLRRRRRGLLELGKKFARASFDVWPRRCTIIATMAALVLLPIEVSHAGWLSDVFKSSSKRDKSPKHVASPKPAKSPKPAASPKHHAVKLAALGPVALSPPALKPGATMW